MPFSDVGTGADVRAEAQRKLKATYVDPILEVARMTTRAPIVNINHDPRFIAIASPKGLPKGHLFTTMSRRFSRWALMLLWNYEFADAWSFMDLHSGPKWHAI